MCGDLWENLSPTKSLSPTENELKVWNDEVQAELYFLDQRNAHKVSSKKATRDDCSFRLNLVCTTLVKELDLKSVVIFVLPVSFLLDRVALPTMAFFLSSSI